MAIYAPITLGRGARTVVCLPGWYGSADNWGPWRTYLDTEEFRWVFFDYRGYGIRMGETGSFTLDEIAKDVLAVIDRLPAGPVHLVGHSMGGSVMQKVLAEAPEGRIGRLVGIAPTPGTGTHLDDDARRLFESAAENSEARRAIIDLTSGHRLPSTWLDRMVENSLLRSIPEAFAAYFRAWADTDLSEQVRGRTNPVLALHGEHDPAVTEQSLRDSYGELFPHAEIRRIGNAGHYPMFETPLALVAEVEEFLAR